MTEQEIANFLSNHNYDIRIHRNARWIDQKCTPDVLAIVADCILNYVGQTEDNAIEFSTQNIWLSEYTIQNVHDIFRKVAVDNNAAIREYDKFFGQPLKLFSYAGILSEQKVGKENRYSIVHFPLLEFIAARERNALLFLTKYITKVIDDSGLTNDFREFFTQQTKQAYDTIKNTFFRFTVANTSIGNKGSSGQTECGRIFTKIINVLAFHLNKRGSEKGRLSAHPITYDMLMYNRDNFRDVYAEKPKNISRKEYLENHPLAINEAYYKYLSTRAKRRLRIYNDQYRYGASEIAGDPEHATHIHHIFPASDFPEISFYMENLIALTPNQHLNNAHPDGRTATINLDYQRVCLLTKADVIEDNIAHSEEILYCFHDFLYVLSIGFDEDSFLEVEDGDYLGIKTKIELAYE